MERHESVISSVVTTKEREDHGLLEGEKGEQSSELNKGGQQLPVTSISVVLVILIWLLSFLYYR